MNNQPKEELVDSRVLRDSLSPEGRAMVDQMAAEANPRIEFMKKLLESMKLSPSETISLMRDTDGSVKPLTLKDILDSVESRGGTVEINITFS